MPTTEKDVLPTILAERSAETAKFDAGAARPGNGQPQDIATDITATWVAARCCAGRRVLHLGPQAAIAAEKRASTT